MFQRRIELQAEFRLRLTAALQSGVELGVDGQQSRDPRPLSQALNQPAESVWQRVKAAQRRARGRRDGGTPLSLTCSSGSSLSCGWTDGQMDGLSSAANQLHVKLTVNVCLRWSTSCCSHVAAGAAGQVGGHQGRSWSYVLARCRFLLKGWRSRAQDQIGAGLVL